jgi:hypothetical protein
MRFHRAIVTVAALGLNLAALGAAALSCSNPDGGVTSPPGSAPPTVTLAQSGATPDKLDGPAGSTFLLTVRATSAGKPVEALSISLSSQPSVVTVSPTSVTTDAEGEAQAYAYVPYDVEGVVIAAGGGSLPTKLTLSNGAVALAGSAGTPAANTPGGTTFPVSVTATAQSGAVGGSTLSFTAQPSGAAVSPASVVTNDAGAATAYAFVPYDTQAIVVVSAAGAGPVSIEVANPAVSLQGSPGVPVGDTPGGTTFQVTVTAQSPLAPGGGAIAGFPISFTAQPSTVTVSPATVSADADGQATTFVFVPYDTQGFLLASGTGAVPATIPVSNAPLALSPLCWQDLTSLGPGLYQVTTYVTAGKTPVPGVGVAFSVVSPQGSSTSTPLFQPATALTNASGAATSLVALGNSFALPDAGSPQVAVQATAGSSTVVGLIPFSAPEPDGGCPPPP